MGFMISQETYGSGVPTGMVKHIIKQVPTKILKALRKADIGFFEGEHGLTEQNLYAVQNGQETFLLIAVTS